MTGAGGAGGSGAAPRLVRAPNPGPMTLEGTNTWLVGTGRVLVVDPGPADEGHVTAVLAEVARDGGRLGGVLLTHRHPDHADALATRALRDALARAGAPVLALDPALGVAPTDDLLVGATDEPVRLLPLPGHTDDSVALVRPGRREVLTGDTVLGRGTSVVAHPDGDLGDYLASLDALLELTGGAAAGAGTGEGGADGDGGAAGEPWTGLPGHGPVVVDLEDTVLLLREHRLQRLAQVRAALARLDGGDHRDGARGVDARVDELVGLVYPDLDDPVLLGAAARTVRATLVHLGRVDPA